MLATQESARFQGGMGFYPATAEHLELRMSEAKKADVRRPK